jgi:hypothetical protein
MIPTCAAGVAYYLILGPLYWEYPLPLGFTLEAPLNFVDHAILLAEAWFPVINSVCHKHMQLH